MTINDIMLDLRAMFGDTYDVRLVPSVMTGGGHYCRATISNVHIDGANLGFSARHNGSYQLALNEAYCMMKRRIGETKAPSPSTEQGHIIPPITDPLGNHWHQPDRTEIKIEDDTATMSQHTFDGLPEYSTTQPTGAYEGKMWKSHVRGVWYLRWFGPAEDPDMVSTNTRHIQIEEAA